ncbi:hypothetical protein DC415_24060 [Agrobacterium tumefaciens]|uniref:Uncharacterized protein n=1 Tax=Rhizobium rhizogenes TaxID=359 RepID=A0AA92BZD2_RHIRH|nr:hypothetical protein DC430_23965 [Rhizobium rhizogenes]PVE61956.1 hypothetical protein DC415_24060 [Agrobacterium tumefaciens]PVE69686.1 hypothetical protein DCP16_24060 [Sphingomonas sp. TPD3009]
MDRRSNVQSAPLCIMSMVAETTGAGMPPALERYPPEWLGSVEHADRALDDARDPQIVSAL